MFRDQLKEQTHHSHIQLEKRIVRYIKNLDSVDSYALLLQQYYGFIKPLEEKIAAFVPKELLPDLSKRMRATVLLQDLNAVGIAAAEAIEVCEDLPVITGVAEAFGALYVLEGSTMGGPYIQAMLLKRLDVENATNYFVGYRDNNRDMWQTFVSVLTAGHFTAHQPKIIDAAEDTFTKFNQWLSQLQLNEINA